MRGFSLCSTHLGDIELGRNGRKRKENEEELEHGGTLRTLLTRDERGFVHTAVMMELLENYAPFCGMTATARSLEKGGGYLSFFGRTPGYTESVLLRPI